VPGIHEKKRMARLAGFPGREVSNVLITTMRSTPAAFIASSTVGMFTESSAEEPKLVDVNPVAVNTASAPENASVSAVRSASDVTTTT
jgi:hypothetical protein